MITCDGLKASKKKTNAVSMMSDPIDKEGVRRVLGTVNYLSKFLPNLDNVVEPLRRLTHNDVAWTWNKEHKESMKKIRMMMVETPLLQYYDPNKELTIQCDASSIGIGATLLQDEKPICYASKTLSDTERRYAQIERECLAIVFSLEKFHQYCFGRKTIIHSDHKPLEAILKKTFYKAPKRLQGMILRILHYDIEVKYKKGTEMYLSDMLSRSPLPVTEKCEFAHINAILDLSISKDRLADLLCATNADMNNLKKMMINGWPENKADVPDELKVFFSYRDELNITDELIFKGEQVIVPSSLRRDFKRRLHTSHLGVDSMLRRARSCVFWPNMSSELKVIYETCESCQTYSRAHQREPLMNIRAESPWEVVGTDLFTWDNKEYLVTVDYFSGFYEMDRLHSTTSNAVIRKLKEHFTRYGICSKLISDNGPQFSSDEFERFVQKWEFEHRTSSPGHPNANGKAESAVKAAKSLMRKCKLDGTDAYLAILEVRNTPPQGMDSSPVQRLMNRSTRSLLPTRNDNLVTRRTTIHEDKQQMRECQKQQADCYDKHAMELPYLNKGDIVRIKPQKLGEKKWKEGVVEEMVDGNTRSYHVISDGVTYRRNRQDLNKSCPTSTNQDPPNQPDNVLHRPTRVRKQPKWMRDYVTS